MAARDLALCVEGVSHSYGARKALDQVSVAVAPGRFVALLGLNGAGKSTLFSLVTRLFAIQTGHIRLFGHDVIRQPGEALRLLGVVFQPRTLDLDLSVRQNLTYHAALHGIKARADILDHVRKLVAEENVAVVWATHLVDEISEGDDLVVLHRGRVLAQG